MKRKSLESPSCGVLPMQDLKKAVSCGYIKSEVSVKKEQFQPSSMDLRLGNRAYRIRSSFLPQKRKTVETLKELKMYEIDLTDGAILEKGNVYLIPLLESLNLPHDISGRTNPKSSTGRLDIFTRVISDRSHRFEDIVPGYKGSLYLEVVPRSFTIRVETGLCLNQLRLFRGEPLFTAEEKRQIELNLNSYIRCQYLIAKTVIPDKELIRMHHEKPLLFYPGKRRVEPVINNGLYGRIEIHNKQSDGIIGYMAKKNSTVIDLSQTGKYRVRDFWEPIKSPHDNFLILEPEEFYIFASKERIRVPIDCAAEMVEFDAGSGELRTHYAGFFDSGFGDKARKGTKAVLEVRPHDVPFRVDDGQIFFKLRYEKMASLPEKGYGQKIGSSYYKQGLSLSKHFLVDESGENS